MSAERIFNAFIVAITVAILTTFLVWYLPEVHADSPWAKTAEIVVAILTGTGLREFLIRSVEFALDHLHWFKRLLLGRSYVEGNWIGYYTESGSESLVIVVIRQEWSDLAISGRAFTTKRIPSGQWHSIHGEVDGGAGLVRSNFSGDFTSGHFDSIVTLHLDLRKRPTAMNGLILDSTGSSNSDRAWIRLRRVEGPINDLDALRLAATMLSEDPSKKN